MVGELQNRQSGERHAATAAADVVLPSNQTQMLPDSTERRPNRSFHASMVDENNSRFWLTFLPRKHLGLAIGRARMVVGMRIAGLATAIKHGRAHDRSLGEVVTAGTCPESEMGLADRPRTLAQRCRTVS